MIKEILDDAITQQAIVDVLEEYKSKWLTIQPIVETKKSLDDYMQESVKLRTLCGIKSKTVTLTKNSIKNTMFKNAELFVSALTAYADSKKLDELRFKVETHHKQLKINKKQMELYETCKAIYTLATTYKTILLEYAITQLMLDEAAKVLKSFEDSIHLPLSAIKAGKAIHKELQENNNATNQLLKNQMDNLILLIATDAPELYDKYIVLREPKKTTVKGKKNGGDLPAINS